LPSVWHSAKPDTRQKDFFVNSQALGKAWYSAKAPSGNGRDPVKLCRVPPTLALDKDTLCRVPSSGTRQTFLFYIFWPPNFLCSPPTVLGTPCYNLVHFCGFLLYLVNLFYLIEFFQKMKIWTAHASNNRI
jgi:hypothetical protein